jgi:hypothetical protein
VIEKIKLDHDSAMNDGKEDDDKKVHVVIKKMRKM